MKKNKKTPNRFNRVNIIVTALVIAVAGFGTWKLTQPTGNEQPAQLASRIPLPEDVSQIKSISDILTIAATDLGTQGVKQIELQQDNGGVLYLLRLADGSTLAYDAFTGSKSTLIESGTEDDDSNEALPAGYRPDVPLLVALKTAKEVFPGSDVAKVKLELEDGTVVYSIRFTDGNRVDVNAATGQIVKQKEVDNNGADASAKSEDDDSDDSATEIEGDDSQEQAQDDDKSDRSGSGSDDSSDDTADKSGSGKPDESKSND